MKPSPKLTTYFITKKVLTQTHTQQQQQQQQKQQQQQQHVFKKLPETLRKP